MDALWVCAASSSKKYPAVYQSFYLGVDKTRNRTRTRTGGRGLGLADADWWTRTRTGGRGPTKKIEKYFKKKQLQKMMHQLCFLS